MRKVTTQSKSAKGGKKSASQKLATVRTKLRHGDFALISKLTGYDPTHVRRVIVGVSNNPSGKIANTAYTVVGKRKVTTA